MSKYTLDTSGEIMLPRSVLITGQQTTVPTTAWPDLTPFTQGALTAALQDAEGATHIDRDTGVEYQRFRGLAPETVARFIEDCAKADGLSIAPLGRLYNANAAGGACYWQDRQSGRLAKIGHPPLILYVADDGLIRIREKS